MLRGISREEILRVTKVSPEYYDALESNRFDRLPQKAFVVGFLRVLSNYAGLDGDDLVNRFLMELDQQEAREEKVLPAASFWRRHFRAFLLGIGILGLIALMFAPLLRN